MGEVEFTKICLDDAVARIELADWVCDNWHDEDSSPEDFSTDDMIEWYFDHYEDYSYYRQPIHGPGNKPVALTQGEDILLTPGMCAIVRNGIAQVTNGQARDLLRDYEELDMDEDADQYDQTAKTIGAMLDQFE
jgi:hypothetical protein